MKALAIALALISFPVLAQSPPAGIKPVVVKMQLFCADSFEYLMNILAVDFGETVIAMGYLKEGENPTTLLIFANEKKTHSTIVVTKRTKMGEQACMAWSGTSPSGMAFSVNPNPQFPPEPERKENGIEM